MPVAKKIADFIGRSSFIREMFEAGRSTEGRVRS